MASNKNAVIAQVLNALGVIHSRTTLNRAPQSPIRPYQVFRISSETPTTPSTDMYLDVYIYDDPDTEPTAIETLADSVQNAMDGRVLRTAALNLHFTLEQRQYVSPNDLITDQMINLRFVIRTYYI